MTNIGYLPTCLTGIYGQCTASNYERPQLSPIGNTEDFIPQYYLSLHSTLRVQEDLWGERGKGGQGGYPPYKHLSVVTWWGSKTTSAIVNKWLLNIYRIWCSGSLTHERMTHSPEGNLGFPSQAPGHGAQLFLSTGCTANYWIPPWASLVHLVNPTYVLHIHASKLIKNPGLDSLTQHQIILLSPQSMKGAGNIPKKPSLIRTRNL